MDFLDTRKKEEIRQGFDGIAKRMFGESAYAEYSVNDCNVIEIHTAQTSADTRKISRFDNATNRGCWVTTNAHHEIIICREI